MIVRYTPARDVRSLKMVHDQTRQKGITDAKRGALFTKVAREISRGGAAGRRRP